MSSWRSLLLRLGEKCPEYAGNADFKDQIDACHSLVRREIEHSGDDVFPVRTLSCLLILLVVFVVGIEKAHFLLQCAEQLPHKIPLYGTLDALETGQCNKIRILMRFLTVLMCSKVIQPSALVVIFESLLSSAATTVDEEKGIPSWQARADFYITCILSCLPWGGAELVEMPEVTIMKALRLVPQLILYIIIIGVVVVVVVVLLLLLLFITVGIIITILMIAEISPREFMYFRANAELPTSHVDFQQVPEEIERVMVGVEAYLSIRRRVSDAGVSVFEDIEETNNVVNEKENNIYYNAGFKSYEIVRCKYDTESWFEWTERSRKLVRRVKVSIKVLRWLVATFIEASKLQGNVVKRWKMKDHYSEFFCTLKYNNSGRYISFVATQGQSKSVIITPESKHMEGWGNIAYKIARFTYEPTKEQNTQISNLKRPEVSYKEAICRSRWTVEAKAVGMSQEVSTKIGGEPSKSENELLKRCIVGRFRNHLQESPNLNDVRKWACNNWKSAAGVNVSAMNDGEYLFELPSRTAAEHVLSGHWSWKNTTLDLQWWRPTAGCWPAEINRDWCGGFFETEEETSLKNHLYWARIKVKGDGRKVPKEIEVVERGFVYTIPVWCEIPVTVRKVELEKENQYHYLAGNEGRQAYSELMAAEIKDGHVGTSKEGFFLNGGARGRDLKGKGKSNDLMCHSRRKNKLGPFLDPLISENAQSYNDPVQSLDLVNVEVQAFTKAGTLNKTSQRRESIEGKEMLQISEVQGVTSTIKDREVYCMAGEVEINEGFQGEDCNIITEEVIPLGIQFPEENFTQTATPAWIQQHIMRLSKEFGVDFKGCEEKAAELFQKIDRNKLENKVIQNEQKVQKRKGLNELKSLELDTNFMSYGTRSKGGFLAIKDQ
ncbi:hypothetical protein MTR67_042071 [Solanum verrucosum]|uniref:DUF4283 domain-containing protein n=1 Tax=Solanum verrucosum TaxID=315347 RepID=A0AAF0UP86_SOLVR|nr:hypothetical protein MTR67_042071 [Solanum verrucosum]